MGYSVGLLNNVRVNASDEYQKRVPEATQENILTIGNAFSTYTVLFNEFAEALFNKIGKTIIEQKLWKNRLSIFKSGGLTSQQDVEEIFIDMAKAAVAYDKDGTNPLGRRNDDNVKVAFHRMNRQDCYEISLGDIDFIRVFRSEATLDNFIKGKLNSVYSRAAHDEYLYMKNILATFDGYATYDVDDMRGNEAGAKSFVKTLRKAIYDVSLEPSTKFNKAGVMSWSKPEDLILFINSDVLAEVDVEILAKAFNMGKTDIQVEIIPMKDFGSLGQTYGLLVDKEFFKVWDTLSRMESIRNPQGLFTNFFYHVHQILSASPFKTAIRFKPYEEL